MKSLFRGVKPFVLILQVTTMVIWAGLNVCFVEKLSDLTALGMVTDIPEGADVIRCHTNCKIFGFSKLEFD